MHKAAEATWIDISVPLRDGMLHWPGDPPVRASRVKDMARGSSANLSEIFMGAHSGTHVDAPVHFLREGKGIDQAEVSVLVGHARVIVIANAESITAEELASHRIRKGERILFKTWNSSGPWHELPFMEDFVYLSGEGARFLAKRKARLVGVDCLSAGSYRHRGQGVHKSPPCRRQQPRTSVDAVRPGRIKTVIQSDPCK